MTGGRWELEPTRVLTASEVKTVIVDLKKRAKRSPNARTNLVLFRLATCAGLRASEVAGLNVSDVRLSTAKPHIYVRKAVAKGHKPRKVPLWWDAGTLDDVTAWREFRLKEDGAGEADPFVCTRAAGAAGNRLHRNAVRNRFLSACSALGKDRLMDLTVHDGRHTFVSHALKHRTLAEVRQAAGHANVSTTSIYLHVAVEDDGKVGTLFS